MLTVTSTTPVPAGAVTVTDVAVLEVMPVAAALPNLTAVAPARFTPVIVTLLPPPSGPLAGLRWVTLGIGSPNASIWVPPADTSATLLRPLTATGTSLGDPWFRRRGCPRR